jgi:hypothetical protein
VAQRGEIFNDIIYDSSYGGGLQYLHRSPGSLRGRREGSPVPEGITHTYIQRPGPPGLGVAKTKVVKTGHSLTESLRKAMAREGPCCQ